MQAINEEAALAGTTSYSENNIAGSNSISNSKISLKLQDRCDLVAAVRRSRSDSAMADALRAALKKRGW
jgi:hypothetical protein